MSHRKSTEKRAPTIKAEMKWSNEIKIISRHAHAQCVCAVSDSVRHIWLSIMVAVHKTWLSIFRKARRRAQKDERDICSACNRVHTMQWLNEEKNTIIAFAENERNNEWTLWKTLKTNSQVEYFHNTIQWFLFDKTVVEKKEAKKNRNERKETIR